MLALDPPSRRSQNYFLFSLWHENLDATFFVYACCEGFHLTPFPVNEDESLQALHFADVRIKVGHVGMTGIRIDIHAFRTLVQGLIKNTHLPNVLLNDLPTECPLRHVPYSQNCVLRIFNAIE